MPNEQFLCHIEYHSVDSRAHTHTHTMTITEIWIETDTEAETSLNGLHLERDTHIPHFSHRFSSIGYFHCV